MSSRGKTEKVSVTLPRDLAAQIRSTVPLGEISSFFTEALEYYMAYRRQKIALAKGFGAWKSDSHPDLDTAEDSTAYVRAIRAADNERLTRLKGADAK
jgi:hypothetical protein